MNSINKQQNIAVLGAGIMGLMSAYSLARALPDARITLFDPRGFPADNASFIAGGMLAPYSELDHMPQNFLQAGLDSISLWEHVQTETGENFEFSQRGSLLIAHPEDTHLLERFKAILPEGGWSVLDAGGISAHEPNLPAQKFRRAIFLPTEAHLNPRKAMHVLCNAITHKETRELSPEEAAQTHDLVIDCRGMAAQDNVPNLRGVKGEVLLVRNPDFTLSRPVRLMHPRYPLYIVPRDDHHFLIGATIIESNDNASVSIRSGMELLSALYSLHPSFSDAQIIEMRAGVRPSLPDNLPRIIRDGRIIRANGLYRHGYLLAPVMARTICALARGRACPHHHLFIKENHT